MEVAVAPLRVVVVGSQHADALRFKILDRLGQVFDADRNMVKSFAMLGDVSAHAPFTGDGG